MTNAIVPPVLLMPPPRFVSFQVTAKDGLARTGALLLSRAVEGSSSQRRPEAKKGWDETEWSEGRRRQVQCLDSAERSSAAGAAASSSSTSRQQLEGASGSHGEQAAGEDNVSSLNDDSLDDVMHDGNADVIKVATPCFLPYTRRGLPPHLMPDIVEGLRAEALHICPLHFLEHPSFSVVASHPDRLRGFVSLPSLCLIAVPRDSLTFSGDSAANDSAGTSFDTPAGRRQVSSSKYLQVIQSLQPDLFVSLPDEANSLASLKRQRAAVTRTLLWLDQTIAACKHDPALSSGLLAPVVGGSFLNERLRSAKQAAEREVAGFYIGGFGLGEQREERHQLLPAIAECLPSHKLRLISGLEQPEDILHAVSEGIDVFDSTYPHLLTLDGFALVLPLSPKEVKNEQGKEENARGESGDDDGDEDGSKLNLHDVKYQHSSAPLLASCGCFTCRTHSRSYIHHLLNSHEMLAQVLLDIHNHHHFLRFFVAIRHAIREGRFEEYKRWIQELRRER